MAPKSEKRQVYQPERERKEITGLLVMNFEKTKVATFRDIANNPDFTTMELRIERAAFLNGQHQIGFHSLYAKDGADIAPLNKYLKRLAKQGLL